MSFVGKAIGNLTGANAAKKANRQAREDLIAGQEQAVGAVTPAYDEAQAILDPYAKGGLSAFQEMVRQATGEGPVDLTRNPAFQSQLAEITKNLNRQLGARGRSNSTFGVNALGDAYTNLVGNEFTNQFNRLGTLSNTGYNAASQKSNLATNKGLTLADIYRGSSTNLAQNRAQKGELAQTFSPLNQATSIFSAGTSLLSPFTGLFSGTGGVTGGGINYNPYKVTSSDPYGIAGTGRGL
jgi:hypothetical protein